MTSEEDRRRYPARWRPFAVRSCPSLETAGDRPRWAGDGPRPVRAGSAWPLVPDRSCLHRPPGSSEVTSRVHSAGTLPTEGCCWSGDAAVAQVEKDSGPAQGAGSAVGVRRRVLLILRPQGGQPCLIMLHPITSAAARAPDMLASLLPPRPSRPGRAAGGPVRSAVGTGSWDLNASATELQTRSPLELDLAAL